MLYINCLLNIIFAINILQLPYTYIFKLFSILTCLCKFIISKNKIIEHEQKFVLPSDNRC